jgi:hypothetical protein
MRIARDDAERDMGGENGIIGRGGRESRPF